MPIPSAAKSLSRGGRVNPPPLGDESSPSVRQVAVVWQICFADGTGTANKITAGVHCEDKVREDTTYRAYGGNGVGQGKGP